MVEIDTLFQTKTAAKKHTLGHPTYPHSLYKGPPSPLPGRKTRCRLRVWLLTQARLINPHEKNDRKFHFINNAVPLFKLDLQKVSSPETADFLINANNTVCSHFLCILVWNKSVKHYSSILVAFFQENFFSENINIRLIFPAKTYFRAGKRRQTRNSKCEDWGKVSGKS